MCLTDGLLLSIAVKPKEIRAVNENEWPGPCDLIAKAAFINTSNKSEESHLLVGWNEPVIRNNERVFIFYLQHYNLLLFSGTVKQFIYTKEARVIQH